MLARGVERPNTAILAGPQRDVIADGCGMGSESGNKLLVPDGRPVAESERFVTDKSVSCFQAVLHYAHRVR
jgi:hypothetical protein